MSVVAICGKGGVGKTTVAALLARALCGGAGRGRALFVDADPAGGLAMALGLEPPRTLDDLRRELITGAGSADATDLLATADYRLVESLVEHQELGLLVVGRPEEEGCYCKLNSFLRQAIETLSGQFALTVVDAEAGIEQVNRRVMRSVSHLLLVSDLSRKGLRVAEAIHEVAAEGGAPRVGLVVNRVPTDASPAVTTLPVLALVPEDPAVRRFDVEARSFFEIPDVSPALGRVQGLLGWLHG